MEEKTRHLIRVLRSGSQTAQDICARLAVSRSALSRVMEACRNDYPGFLFDILLALIDVCVCREPMQMDQVFGERRFPGAVRSSDNEQRCHDRSGCHGFAISLIRQMRQFMTTAGDILQFFFDEPVSAGIVLDNGFLNVTPHQVQLHGPTI